MIWKWPATVTATAAPIVILLIARKWAVQIHANQVMTILTTMKIVGDFLTDTKSRAYKTCERILKHLIVEYGPTARIGWPLVQRAIKEVAGHDPRTVRNYLESLCQFRMLKPVKGSINDLVEDISSGHLGLFELNWVKVADYKQLTMKDVEAAENVENR
jgi:hypothetical protein